MTKQQEIRKNVECEEHFETLRRRGKGWCSVEVKRPWLVGYDLDMLEDESPVSYQIITSFLNKERYNRFLEDNNEYERHYIYQWLINHGIKKRRTIEVLDCTDQNTVWIAADSKASMVEAKLKLEVN